MWQNSKTIFLTVFFILIFLIIFLIYQSNSLINFSSHDRTVPLDEQLSDTTHEIPKTTASSSPQITKISKDNNPTESIIQTTPTLTKNKIWLEYNTEKKQEYTDVVIYPLIRGDELNFHTSIHGSSDTPIFKEGDIVYATLQSTDNVIYSVEKILKEKPNDRLFILGKVDGVLYQCFEPPCGATTLISLSSEPHTVNSSEENQVKNGSSTYFEIEVDNEHKIKLISLNNQKPN